MAEFNEASLWMKLSTMLVSASFSMHLFSMDTPGWSGYEGQSCPDMAMGVCNTNMNAARAVKALEVLGFLFVLISLFLSLCLVLLDEMKRNRLAIVFLCLFSIIGGLAIIVGIAVFEGQTNVSGISPDGSEFASTIGVMAGVSSILAGIFCLLDLLGLVVYY